MAAAVVENSISSVLHYEHIIWFLVGRELNYDDRRTLRLVAKNFQYFLKNFLNFAPRVTWDEINTMERELISCYQISVTDTYVDKEDPFFGTIDFLRLKENNTFTMQLQIIVENKETHEMYAPIYAADQGNINKTRKYYFQMGYKVVTNNWKTILSGTWKLTPKGSVLLRFSSALRKEKKAINFESTIPMMAYFLEGGLFYRSDHLAISKLSDLEMKEKEAWMKSMYAHSRVKKRNRKIRKGLRIAVMGPFVVAGFVTLAIHFTVFVVVCSPLIIPGYCYYLFKKKK